MADSLSKRDRSALMARVKGKGNRSTEKVVEKTLKALGIKGWQKHPKNVFGKPDFYFKRERLALFVDGCFWHACPHCGRLPKSRPLFWLTKIHGNRRRDYRVRRTLRKEGIQTIRIWEHELNNAQWLKRLCSRLRDCRP
jgi:DNA mismatch endonuclease (patch repair protein)